MTDRRKRTAWVMGVGLLVAGGTAAPADNRDEDKPLNQPIAALPEVEPLPDPFVFLDGSTGKDPADWKRRRTELMGSFEDV